MKIFIITILLVSCGQGQPSQNRVVLTTAEEIIALKARLYKLEQDTVLRAKQVKALQKLDSLNLITANNLSLKIYLLTARHYADSVAQWKSINKIINNNLTQEAAISSTALKVYNLTARVLKDSVTLTRDNLSQWKEINKMVSIPLRYVKDSIYHWIAIIKLQGASPVTQIPIIQSQIKSVTDSLKTLKVFVTIMNDQVKLLSKERVYLDTADFRINRATGVVSISPLLIFDPTKGGGIDTIPKTLDIPLEEKK